MTALTRYDRLEGSGLWRPDAGAQRRDVGVRLGKSSLVISDTRSGTVLSHWSLATVRRDNPGRHPARFSPGPEDDGELLETDDQLLIQALETILQVLQPPARGRRLRWALVGLALVAALVMATWLPQILSTRTAAIVPDAMRARIGREALDNLARPGGTVRVCAEPSARQMLGTYRNQILGPNWRVQVIDGLPGFEAAHLPGQIVVLSRTLVERLDSPEALAGWLVSEELAATARDPLLDVLRHAGLRATLSLLSVGTLPDGALQTYAASHLIRSRPRPDAAALVARLGGLGIDSGPYAASLPGAAGRLIAAQPARTTDGTPLMTDGQWLTLQAVCER